LEHVPPLIKRCACQVGRILQDFLSMLSFSLYDAPQRATRSR